MRTRSVRRGPSPNPTTDGGSVSKRPANLSDVQDHPHDNRPLVIDREFSDLGDQRYQLKLMPAGVRFQVERVRRESKELWGELSVRVNGQFPTAKTIQDGVVSIGDLNFSSVQARGTRAKVLQARSGSSIDWEGFLEEFVVKVIDAERKGKPGVVLADLPETPDSVDTWDVDGIPILSDLPMVIFGQGGAMKSLLALWIAGTLAERGITVLYADWELAAAPHQKRLGQLFQPKPRGIVYARCERPLRDEADRLRRIAVDYGAKFIVFDSIVGALDGPADDERAGSYYRYVRQFGSVGSLHLAHLAKHETEGETRKTVFGSGFFEHFSRSIWYAHRAEEHAQGEQHIGLFHTKSTGSELLRPKGFTLTWRQDRVSVARCDVAEIDELAALMPLLDRARKHLTDKGPQTNKGLADALGVGVPSVLKMMARHRSVFIQVAGQKVAVAAPQGGEVDF